MTQGLPLIPAKGGACGDVRAVLRGVFRASAAPLPPLGCAEPPGPPDQWRRLGSQERLLRRERAGRVARHSPRNKYRLGGRPPPAGAGDLRREDLEPETAQNATRDACLWLENALAASSAELEVRGAGPPPPPGAEVLPLAPCPSSLTLSLGEPEGHPPPPPSRPPRPPPPPQPEYVRCVPPALEFVDFVLHREHTRTLRLVNVSAVEVRLAVLPPARRELDVELGGRLTVTSGAATELRVRFVPRDVRVLRDRLLVRVSLGRPLAVPIACYMRPPLLDVVVRAEAAAADMGAARRGDTLDLGARLLGDAHKVRVELRCAAEHAAFFLLTEEAWLSGELSEVSPLGVVSAGPFRVWPAAWRGGGSAGGWARCRPRAAGLHAAALRVLASTAVARPLCLLADALLYRADHVTLRAHDKDYDVAAPDDPACEHYAHLGTALPHRALAATVHVLNRSPVAYSYRWSVRPWGACSCGREEPPPGAELGPEDDGECPEARRWRAAGGAGRAGDAETAAVRVDPAEGSVSPHSSCAARVSVPDVGDALGTRRVVLMLVLTDVPRESFPPDFQPDVVRSVVAKTEPIPGEEAEERETCDVVCAQLEVWWEVAPLRFALDPPALLLRHSRRITAVRLSVRATQLFGGEGAHAAWRVTAASLEGPRELPAPPPPHLSAARSATAALLLPLAAPPDERALTDAITLTADDAEWTARCSVRRVCPERHPAVGPPRSWLGVAPPGAHMRAELAVRNDTHQRVWWAAAAWRWCGERPPSASCRAARAPCPQCRERTCSCGLLRPLRAELAHGGEHAVLYDVNAPERDGCVATLVRVRRAEADCAAERAAAGEGAGTSARAALVAYRVLAPRLVLRVLPCAGAGLGHAECACACSPPPLGAPSGGAAALLRPGRALVLGARVCWRLRVRNLTPLPTSVRWQAPPDGENVLKVIFIPNDFDVGSYAQMEIQVVVEGVAVSGRRVFVRRAAVARARRPLYLLLDAAVAGLEVEFQIPIGGAEHTDAFALVRRTQRPPDAGHDTSGAEPTPEEAFAAEDLKRAVRAENRCRCRSTLQYVPPPRRPQPPPAEPDRFPPVEIVWSPPPLTRVCRCWRVAAPLLPAEEERRCLQFRQVPLRTVRERAIVLRNVSALTARWSACVRRWPLRRVRTLVADPWAAGVGDLGVALAVRPAQGVLPVGAEARLELRVYADTWGVYRDQLLVQISQLEPLVVDVWVEALGPPLDLALQPRAPSPSPWALPALSPPLDSACALAPSDAPSDAPVLWMSAADESRSVRATNASRAQLLVRALPLRAHDRAEDALPLRLYVRLFDVPARSCPCLGTFASDSALEASSASEPPEEPDVGVELFLGPDLGVQEGVLLTVEPELRPLAAGEAADWRVALVGAPEAPDGPPDHVLLLRALPQEPQGPEWARPEPAAQTVLVAPAPRQARLLVPRDELAVELCALHLPVDDVLRVRKRLRVQNVGDGHLHAAAGTGEAWSVVRGESGPACGAGCARRVPGRRLRAVPLCLPPRSAAELCIELRVRTADVWPAPAAAAPFASPLAAADADPPAYPERRELIDALTFYDGDNVLQTVRLVLRLELPRLIVEPEQLNLGYVYDGDCRKGYITVAHTSRSERLRLSVRWAGAEGARLRPPRLALAPGERGRVYVQLAAAGGGRPQAGAVRLRAAGAAGAWCRARVPVRCAPSRDARCHAEPHDHTDDCFLLPPDL